MTKTKVRLYIPRKVYHKIDYFVQKCSGEVSGMGLVSYVADGNYFWVRDVFLLEQEVGSAHTDIDPVSLGQLEYHVLKNKLEGELNFWWHSHVNMATFWSGTDIETINKIGSNGYCVATVFNKKREMRSAVSFKSEGMLSGMYTFIDEVETTVYDAQPTEADKAEWDAEIEAKVKEKKYVYSGTSLYDWHEGAFGQVEANTKVATLPARAGHTYVYPLRKLSPKSVRKAYNKLQEDENVTVLPHWEDLLMSCVLGVNIHGLDERYANLDYVDTNRAHEIVEEFLHKHKELEYELYGKQ